LDSQIVGGADWIDTEHYDIDAKVDRPSTLDQLHEMFRSLLANRFQLQFHRETRLASAYVMTGVRSGAKLTLSESHEQFDVPIKPDGAGRMVGTRVPMSYLALFLSQQLDTPVVNDTGLDGYYDFTAWLSPERGAGLSVVADSSGARRQTWTEGVIVAVREQLGLTLQQRKAPVEVFVIDHAAKPEAN
jgi:uncharacterized protein (TIGR03435 family)